MQRDSALLQHATDALRFALRKRGLAICISGMDGSGKTTLARQLVDEFGTAGVPTRHLHLYQWFINLAATPLLILYNRHIGRRVLVFDRTIFDNIAVAAVSRWSPRWLPKFIMTVAHSLYPRFDYRFYLVADLGETRRRRPETREQRFAELTRVYDWITSTAGHAKLTSDTALLGKVLGLIAAARADH